MGMETVGTWSLAAPVMGVCVQGAMTSLDGVMVDLGGLQTGCVGVTRLAGGCGAQLGHLFVLSLRGKAGKHDLFVLGACIAGDQAGG